MSGSVNFICVAIRGIMNDTRLGFVGILGASIATTMAASFTLSHPLYAQTTRVLAKPTPRVLVKPTPRALIKPSPEPAAATQKPLSASPGRGVEAKFEGLRDSQGQVCLSLFSGAKDFPKDTSPDLLLKRCAPITNKTASIVFSDLKPGDYAIAAFHDANSDSKLNKGAFGIPEEGFGFSNNPEIGFSAPSFTETKFKVSGTPSAVQIKFRYMK
jgi:uncharacterized protein (DUF2141 family)